MNTITAIARSLFAIAIAALGIQHFVYLHFLPDLEPVPVWLRDRAIPACIMGAFLVAIAFSMVIGKMDRQAAALLGVICLLNSLLVHLPRVIADLHNGNEWTTCFELLAISSGALFLAGILRKNHPPVPPPAPDRTEILLSATGSTDLSVSRSIVFAWRRFTGKLISMAPYFFALSLLVFAVLHFVYADYIATLIPAWIPARLFWSYFVGIAFLTASLGITIKKGVRLAAILMGGMFYSWVAILHLPRVIASPQIESEWASMFVALAIGSAAWMLAALLRRD